jgi:hypothetical protein
MKNVRKILVLIAGAVLLAGCSEGGQDNGSDSGNSIVGDWFPCDDSDCFAFADAGSASECEDIDCSEIADDGTRFRSDGTWVSLESPGGLPEADGRYCVELGNREGEYTWDGHTLTLTKGSQRDSVEVELNGDRAVFKDIQVSVSHGDPLPPQDIEVIRIKSYTKERCEGDDPPSVKPLEVCVAPDGGQVDGIRFGQPCSEGCGEEPVFCHTKIDTCVLGCEKDPDCPGAWICDDRTQTVEDPDGPGRPICVDPTCGS